MRFVYLLTASLLWIGCVGPSYHKPKIATPESFENSKNSTQLTGEPAHLARWWTSFNDPMLNSLIERAITSNLDLKMARARIREARAAKGQAAADFWPSIDGTGSYTRYKQSENIVFSPGSSSGDSSGAGTSPTSFGGTSGSLYQLGFDATWEIDIFGGKRRAYQAAKADMQAFEERQRDVLVTLLGDVAQSYVDVRGYQSRLDVANENIKAQTEAVRIATSRMNAGLTSELDLSQASGLLATTEAQVPLIENGLKASLHRLGVLLGKPPTFLYEELSKSEAIPSVPTTIATGLPSDLLRRRPDVRAAERDLAAATARIGVAKGEYFPKISLLGGFGVESLTAGDLISSGSKFWSIGPSLRWPLFQMGKLRAGVKIQTARQEQAAAQYEKTVLMALEDSENAIVTFINEQIRRQHLADAVAANQKAEQLSNERYLNGLSDFLNVVDAQRSLYTAQDQLIQSQRSVSVALVSLYKALGGGWEPEEDTQSTNDEAVIKTSSNSPPSTTDEPESVEPTAPNSN